MSQRGLQGASTVVGRGEVQLEDVGMTFGTGGVTTQAIVNVTGTVPDRKFLSVIGPSGCGKSTLLDLVFGLQRPTTGRVLVGGKQLTAPRRDAAMVFQEDSTLHWRTVLENVALGLEVAGVGRRERHERAREMINLVGLAGFESHRPRQLSGGMKQRVAIARALATDPQMLLMDEPFGSLDQQTRLHIGRELTRIWEATRKTVLFVTHDIQEAVLLSDEVWVMSRRPSRLKARIPIQLDRPRPRDVMKTADFHTYVDQLWDLLSVEVTLDDFGTHSDG